MKRTIRRNLYTAPSATTRLRLSRIATVHPFRLCQKPRTRRNFEFTGSLIPQLTGSARAYDLITVYDTQVCALLYGPIRRSWYELYSSVVIRFQNLYKHYLKIAKFVKKLSLRRYNFV